MRKLELTHTHATLDALCREIADAWRQLLAVPAQDRFQIAPELRGRIAELARRAIERLRPFALDNVKIQTFDGTFGWSDVGPFDRILVTAAAPEAPQPLLDQLKDGGKLVVPEGERNSQHLVLYHKTAEGLRRKVGEAVSLVPLIGRHGWAEEERA